ncbi:unnamed protein product [Rotaria sp. Silwood1]|nr:unnamed protein product [Rotaria sp. Silwood1]CAF3738773.1 unnamed protein product [Rotaria sp. Silwood1]CAF3785530.1 unnamed protein product [Rotaria sp. Silwood1]CAF4884846.1 unnamed protein product [Rotaria sp. Silwood1]CAF4952086.1 unnamed protein product [Rotaria sp. Silwood1]
MVNAASRNGIRIQPHIPHQSLNAQLLRMLLVQVVSFVALTMPFSAWGVYTGVSLNWSKSQWRRDLEALLSVCFTFLVYVNNGLSCIVYALTARLFRQELRALFYCRWRKFLRHQQHGNIFLLSQRIAPVPARQMQSKRINNYP